MASISAIFSLITITALNYGCVVTDSHEPLNVSIPTSLKEYEGVFYNNGSSIELSKLFWPQSKVGTSDGIYELEIRFRPPDSLLIRAFGSFEEGTPAKESILSEGEDFRFEDGFITKPEWEKGYKLGIEDDQMRSLLLLMDTKIRTTVDGAPLVPVLFIERYKYTKYIRYVRSVKLQSD